MPKVEATPLPRSPVVPTTPADLLWRWRAAILLIVTLAARAATVGNPIVYVDEEFYLTVARAMLHGQRLYVDVWDRKPIGLFLLYMPVAWLPPMAAVVGYQLLASGFVWATALVAAALADRAGWRRGAVIGASLYILWLDLADGQGGQAPAFYNLFTAVAALAAMRAGDVGVSSGLRLRLGLAAMLVVGLALQVKYSVVFEGSAFGLWLLWIEWRASRSVPTLVAHGAAWVTAALLPTVLAFCWYAAHHEAQAFLYANFLSILERGNDPWADQWHELVGSAQILAPLLVLVLAGQTRAADWGVAHRRHFIYAWLFAAALGFLVFGSWFNHYTLPVMLPASVCAAALFARWHWARLAALPLVALVFAAGQRVGLSERTHRGTQGQFAALAAAVGRGPGSLYVYSGTPMLYTFSGRPALTRYLMPGHLLLNRETGAIGVDQRAEVARVLHRRPNTVVMQSWDEYQRPDMRPMLLHTLARSHYALVAVLPIGRNIVSVYRAPV